MEFNVNKILKYRKVHEIKDRLLVTFAPALHRLQPAPGKPPMEQGRVQILRLTDSHEAGETNAVCEGRAALSVFRRPHGDNEIEAISAFLDSFLDILQPAIRLCPSRGWHTKSRST